jgi:hypothetical protein
MSASIDTADHVKHGPTGETWVVAYVDGDRLAWCGWPEGEAKLADCELVKKATESERDELLQQMANSRDDRRSSYATHRLNIKCDNSAVSVGSADPITQRGNMTTPKPLSSAAQAVKSAAGEAFWDWDNAQPRDPQEVAAFLIRRLVILHGKPTPGGSVILSGDDLLTIATELEGHHV